MLTRAVQEALLSETLRVEQLPGLNDTSLLMLLAGKPCLPEYARWQPP